MCKNSNTVVHATIGVPAIKTWVKVSNRSGGIFYDHIRSLHVAAIEWLSSEHVFEQLNDNVRLPRSLIVAVFRLFGYKMVVVYIDGLAQDCSDYIANALELLQSCAKLSICYARRKTVRCSYNATPYINIYSITAMIQPGHISNIWTRTRHPVSRPCAEQQVVDLRTLHSIMN